MTVSVDKKTLKIIFSICVLAVAICIAVCVSEIQPRYRLFPRQMNTGIN